MRFIDSDTPDDITWTNAGPMPTRYLLHQRTLQEVQLLMTMSKSPYTISTPT